MRINIYESCSCFSIIKTKTISEKDINGRVNYSENMTNSKNFSPAPSSSRLTARELSLSLGDVSTCMKMETKKKQT